MTEELRFLVPDELADEIEAAGLVSTRSDMEYRGAADVGEVALIVYNVTVTTLTLAEMPGQIVALRDSIARWVRKSPPDQRPYSLEAEGPGGKLSLSVDDPPDLDALMDLLRSIYPEGDAPQ